MNIHDLIDQFVKVVDPSATIFRQIDSAPWIESLEKLLPRRFPVSFGSLITRYAFRTFDADGIHFFANTGDESLDELNVAIFNDRNIAHVTHANGFIQFARLLMAAMIQFALTRGAPQTIVNIQSCVLTMRTFCVATKSVLLRTSLTLSTVSHPTLGDAHNNSLDGSRGQRLSHHHWSGAAAR